MPCSDGRDDVRLQTVYRDRPETVQNLCEAYRILTAHNLIHFVGVSGQRWWKAHEQEDRARVEAERMKLEKEQKRQHILSKLTAEERKILGI